MNSFRLLIWSAAICGAAVFTGCVDTASNQLSPMEQEWERAIRTSYPGYRTPKTMPPAVRDSVVYYEAPKPASAPADIPAATLDPATAVDNAAANAAADVVPAPVEPVKSDAPADAKKVDAPADVKKADAPADEKKVDAKKDKGNAEAVVKAGDTIGGIAKEFYGNAKYADVILKANPQVKDAKRLKIGTKLIIPAL